MWSYQRNSSSDEETSSYRPPVPRRPSLNRVKRQLFDPPNPEENKRFFEQEMRKHQEDSKRRWNFDFEKDRPLRGRLEWEEIPREKIHPVYNLTRLPYLNSHEEVENRSPRLLTSGGGGGCSGGALEEPPAGSLTDLRTPHQPEVDGAARLSSTTSDTGGAKPRTTTSGNLVTSLKTTSTLYPPQTPSRSIQSSRSTGSSRLLPDQTSQHSSVSSSSRSQLSAACSASSRVSTTDYSGNVRIPAAVSSVRTALTSRTLSSVTAASSSSLKLSTSATASPIRTSPAVPLSHPPRSHSSAVSRLHPPPPMTSASASNPPSASEPRQTTSATDPRPTPAASVSRGRAPATSRTLSEKDLGAKPKTKDGKITDLLRSRKLTRSKSASKSLKRLGRSPSSKRRGSAARSPTGRPTTTAATAVVGARSADDSSE